MILVTGAAGKTGKALISALVDRGRSVRALVHRTGQRDEMLRLGVTQVIAGDLGDRSIIERAVHDAEAVYHICPNVDPLEIEYGRLLIHAAATAGVTHFGYHSVLHPQTERMKHHWKKLRVEEALFESGLPFTIVQPCAYMQNLLGQKEAILSGGIVEVPYSLGAKLSLVDLQDVATVIAMVLGDPGHYGATYELAGPDKLDYEQIAATLQAVLAKPIKAVQIDVAEWEIDARKRGLGGYQIMALRSMFAYYDQFGFCGNSNVLAHLLGRQPATLEDYVRREVAAQ